MFRRSLIINCVFSLVSTAFMMAFMPSPGTIAAATQTSLLSYAQGNELLSPLVHRILSPR